MLRDKELVRMGGKGDRAESWEKLGLYSIRMRVLCSVAQMAPAKKGGEKKKGRSAINEVVTREYTINIHKRIHGV